MPKLHSYLSLLIAHSRYSYVIIVVVYVYQKLKRLNHQEAESNNPNNKIHWPFILKLRLFKLHTGMNTYVKMECNHDESNYEDCATHSIRQLLIPACIYNLNQNCQYERKHKVNDLACQELSVNFIFLFLKLLSNAHLVLL